MTYGRCFRGEAGGFVRTAARVAAVLVIAATFAALWAGPAASASGSRTQALASGLSRHAKVKYYIVPQPGHGPPVALYGIAVRTLGDSHRYIEIFNLNKGRRQPNGGRLDPAAACGRIRSWGPLRPATRTAAVGHPAGVTPAVPVGRGRGGSV